MRTFGVFLLAVIAVFLLLANAGPLVILAIGVWLLYLIFRQFVKASTTGGKIVWLLLGVLVLSFTVPNVFGLLAVLGAYVLYVLFFRKDGEQHHDEKDLFTDLERG